MAKTVQNFIDAAPANALRFTKEAMDLCARFSNKEPQDINYIDVKNTQKEVIKKKCALDFMLSMTLEVCPDESQLIELLERKLHEVDDCIDFLDRKMEQANNAAIERLKKS